MFTNCYNYITKIQRLNSALAWTFSRVEAGCVHQHLPSWPSLACGSLYLGWVLAAEMASAWSSGSKAFWRQSPRLLVMLQPCTQTSRWWWESLFHFQWRVLPGNEPSVVYRDWKHICVAFRQVPLCVHAACAATIPCTQRCWYRLRRSLFRSTGPWIVRRQCPALWYRKRRI